MKTIISMAVILALISTGCIAPSVESLKRQLIINNPACTSNCTAGKVTANMNSGTSVKAEVDQDVSPDTQIKLK